MRENPYKRLPPIERKPDGSLYRMTPAQKKQAASYRVTHYLSLVFAQCFIVSEGVRFAY